MPGHRRDWLAPRSRRGRYTYTRRRILLWRIRIPLWAAGAAAGWGIGRALGGSLAAQVAGAASGLVIALIAGTAFSHGRVLADGGSPQPSPERLAAARAEAHRRQQRWTSGAVPSPGGWQAPPGKLPAWNWTPPEGMRPRMDRVPGWVRLWYRTPFADRYAHAWMWHHGGWDVLPPVAGLYQVSLGFLGVGAACGGLPLVPAGSGLGDLPAVGLLDAVGAP